MPTLEISSTHGPGVIFFKLQLKSLNILRLNI